MIADITLNHQIKAKAGLDTGCSYTLIDSTFAAENRLPVNYERGMKMLFPLGMIQSYQLQMDSIDINGLHNTRPVYVGNLRKYHRKTSDYKYDILMGCHYRAQDGSRMLTLNIADGYIEYGKREIDENFKKTIMTVDEQGFIGIDAPMNIETQDRKSGQLNGRFVIDTGNANFFFLCGKNEVVTQFLHEKKIKPEETIKGGKTLKYMRMHSAEILGKKVDMRDDIIVILPKIRLSDYVGAIGFKFLKKVEMIVDYDNNLLYMK